MREMIVEIEGIKLLVTYKFVGDYYPATNDSPEEIPELDIKDITLLDSEINIYSLLSDWQLEIIYNKLENSWYD